MRKKHALAAHKAPVATADVIAFRLTDGDHAAIAHIAPDQAIFRQGEPCDAVFYLRAGAAKVHVLSKSGREAVIIILGPGEFFGEGAIMLDQVAAGQFNFGALERLFELEQSRAPRSPLTSPSKKGERLKLPVEANCDDLEFWGRPR